MFAHLAASLHTLGFTVQTRLRRDEAGATAVEYGIMVALIAVVIIAAVTLLGGGLDDAFNGIACAVNPTGGQSDGTACP